MATYCNAFKMETDENKFDFAQNPDSFESWQGRRGPYYTPVVSADGTLSWVNNGGLPNPQPVNIAGPPGHGLEIQGVVETVQQLPTGAAQGDVWLVGTDSPYEAYIWVSGGWLDLGQVAVGPQGPQGEDGVSPEIAVSEISGGHRVTITDAGGTEAFDVLDGEDGQPGSPGAAGVSPDVTVTTITGGHRVTITDADGTQTFDVLDGEDGQPGSPGAAGVSPDVTVTAITGGHRVTITDAGGTQTFDVMDGEDGAQGATGPAGPGVPAGGTAGQILAKADATNYNTHWINPPDPGEKAWTLMWENASTIGSDFAAQTIPIDLTGMTELKIYAAHYDGMDTSHTGWGEYIQLVPIGVQTSINASVTASNKVSYTNFRYISASTSGVTFGRGIECSTAAGQTYVDNSMQPLKIFAR